MEMASLGEILLVSSIDNPKITAYESSSGAIVGHFIGSRSACKGIILVGSKLIAVAHISYSPSPAATLHLYNWWSSTPLHRLPLPELVSPLVSTPDGHYLFCGGVSGYIHALTIPSGHLLRSILAHPKHVSSCIINDDASLLISGGDDGTLCVFPLIQLLDVNDEQPINALYCFSAHASTVTALASGCGGSNIISSSLDCTCKFWSLAHAATLVRTVHFPCMICCLVLDSTESNFYVGGSDGVVYIGDLKVDKRPSNAKVVALTPEHNGAIISVAMVNKGKNLISASEEGIIRMWEVDRGTVVRVIGDGRESISDVVVAKGVRDYGVSRGFEIKGSSLVYCGRQISRSVRELGELEESLNVVVKDRRRAIDTLEGTIQTYQRLLGLILKEAKRGIE